MNTLAARCSLGLSSPGARSARLGSLALLAALCATPAFAETFTYPGTMCQTEAAVDRPSTGALLNASPGSTSVSKFHCPIVRTRAASAYGGTLTVALNVKLNYSQNFDCALRSTTANGIVMDTATVVIPAKSSYNAGFWTANFSVTLVPGINTSVNLRCDVPNFASEAAGIMSYTVTD